MARSITMIPLLLFLLFLSIFSSTSIKPASARRGPRSRSSRQPAPRSPSYVESVCRTTLYKDLCVRSLSNFPESSIQTINQLTQHALAVSLYKATSTRSYMLDVAKELKAMGARDYPLVRDCLAQINDGVDQLTESIRELRRLERQGTGGGRSTKGGGDNNVFWHISNVESWVAAAETDASTCMGNFPGRNMSKLKATLKGKVMNVAQTTSNALAFFHRYASSYKSTQRPASRTKASKP